MTDNQGSDEEKGRRLKDGRRQLLVFLKPETIKQTKQRALDDETSASAIVEEALSEWHERHKPEDKKT
jgi:hypothetical protein